jgi:transposase
MEVVYRRCAGIDVHKEMVVCCVRISESRTRHETRTFATTTKALLELRDWLQALKCTNVAMESTGVYWRPIWHILEGSFELLLANPAHMKNVPGRKTDVQDAHWIADLLAHGLLKGSFIPDAPILELRDLMRTRRQLVAEKARHIQRIQKTLEDANIKATMAMTDLMSQAGRAILKALMEGESDPERLAALGCRTLRKVDKAQLVECLRGHIQPRHRFFIRLHYAHIEHLETAIATVEAEVERAIAPFKPAVELLQTIPGVSETSAQTIIAEMGVEMARFKTSGHLVSWVGLCPRNDESAGKRRSVRIRPGTPWLKTALVQTAWAATRKKNSYLRAQFQRLKARRGPHKAIIAVAASILTAAYNMLWDGNTYQDLGQEHFQRLDKHKAVGRLVRKLEEMGVKVEIANAA